MKPKEKAPHRERHAPTKAKRARQGSQQANKPKATTPPPSRRVGAPILVVAGPPIRGASDIVGPAVRAIGADVREAELRTNDLAALAWRVISHTSPDAPDSAAWTKTLTVEGVPREELLAEAAHRSLPVPDLESDEAPCLISTRYGRQIVALSFPPEGYE